MFWIVEVVMEVGLIFDCFFIVQYSCRSICSFLQRFVLMVGDVWFLGGFLIMIIMVVCIG